MWAALPVVVNALLSGALRDGVVAALYKEIFSSHVTGARCALPSVLLQLQSSALSDTTKGRLPGCSQVECTIKNTQWVMGYWCAVNELVETPLDGECGYIRGATPGSVTFAC